MARVSIHRLSPDDVDEAYVLARLGNAGLTLKAWRVRAAARNGLPTAGGLLLARDQEARPCGLAVYALTDTPDGRRIVQIESLIGFDVLDPQSVASALVAEVVRLAHAAGCETLCLMQPLGPAVEVAARVLASGVAVLSSLFGSPPPIGQSPSPIDPDPWPARTGRSSGPGRTG